MISQRWSLAALVVSLLLLLAACGGGDDEESRGDPPPEPPPITDFQIIIGAFDEGSPIPAQYSCEGKGISPEIVWIGAPVGTNSFAVDMDDPDAPGGVFDHWVLFNLPPHLEGLSLGVSNVAELAGGGTHGRNSTGNVGYLGPCPPPGSAHHYRFTAFALDRMLELDSSANKQDLLDAMSGHILADSLRTGTYLR